MGPSCGAAPRAKGGMKEHDLALTDKHIAQHVVPCRVAAHGNDESGPMVQRRGLADAYTRLSRDSS